VPVRTARGIDYRWVNTKRSRNEPLDCTVYAVFCTHALGLHTRTRLEWDRVEQAVQPATADLFAQRAADGEPSERKPAPVKPVSTSGGISLLNAGRFGGQEARPGGRR
jgi:phage terminase large subunit GpA-like protein